MTNKKNKKNRFSGRFCITANVLAWLLVTFFVIDSFNRFGGLFVLSKDQSAILIYLNDGFQDGNNNVKLDGIYDGDWDKICLVPAYSFGPLTHENVEQYLGDGYKYNWLFSPHPYAVTYGLGFSFLKDRKLEKFIRIPPYKITFFEDDKILSRKLNLIEYTSLDNREINEDIHFHDLNVSTQEKDNECYSRSTAFLQIKGYQHIFVGELKHAAAKAEPDPEWLADKARMKNLHSENLSEEENCQIRWDILWPWAKQGELEARIYLYYYMFPAIHSAILSMPGTPWNYLSQWRHGMIVGIHSLGGSHNSGTDDELYTQTTNKIIARLVSDDSIFRKIGARKFLKCLEDEPSQDCAKIAVDKRIIPSFKEYAAEIDALLAQGVMPTCTPFMNE